MAAPERFADKSDSSCTAGAVHTWPFAAFQTNALNGRYWPVAAFSPFGSLPLPVGSDVFADAAHRAPGSSVTIHA